MSTTTTWPGGATDASPTAYTVPASGELNWASLSSFLNVLATSAQSTTAQKWGVRVATTTPVTVSATADCVVVTKLGSPGAVAVNLPAGANKQVFVVVDGTGDAATNNVTITPNGAETINGAATLKLTANREAVVLVYSTTNTIWNVVARYVAGTILTNPMATTGDMIYGGASGVTTNLATGATAGVLHGGNAAVPTWSTIVNADVSSSAAIAGSKLQAATSSNTGTINWYEESTFTPTVTGSTGAGTTVTYAASSQVGQFTRIGRRVNFLVYVSWTNWTGSPTGNVRIAGLPYAVKNTTNAIPVITVLTNNIVLAATTTWVVGLSNSGGTTIDLYGGKTAGIDVTDASLNAGSATRGIYASGSYDV